MASMGKTDVMSFGNAIEDSDAQEGGRSVLLGNGFSIDWDAKRFHYESLYDEAKLTNLSIPKEDLFAGLNTHDFEKVIEHLKTAAKLTEVYSDTNGGLVNSFRDDAKVVQNGLADVLAARHPHVATEVTDSEAEKAREFLANFGRSFTLNYDLLLYWVLSRLDSKHTPQRGDGLEWPTAEPGKLVWKRSAAKRGQRVFYLHGALHYFVEEHRLNKLSYQLSAPLLEQIRTRIEAGKYPLVVTEGTSEEKLERIEASAYLSYAHRRFEELTGVLFIHGFSFSPNDEHVLMALEAKACQIASIYVGLHNPGSDEALAVMRRANQIKNRRAKSGGIKLAMTFYDAKTAHLWR